jgi:hypothetical protein
LLIENKVVGDQKKFIMGSYPSGQRGLTVNQLSEDFGGSNPSLPTTGMFPAARQAHIAQSVEHTLGKGEVTSPNLVVGSVAEMHWLEKKETENGEAKI